MFGLYLPLARSGIQSLRILLVKEAFPADGLHFGIFSCCPIVANEVSYPKIPSVPSKWPDWYPIFLRGISV